MKIKYLFLEHFNFHFLKNELKQILNTSVEEICSQVIYVSLQY
jgi:hypothetical protein